MVTSSPPTSAPRTDKTGMDFRRILPEIRCQSCLSPGSEPTPRGGFSPLLGWAFRPRKLMKNCHADFIGTHERPGTDKTGMDFRRILPEIRCQSCLSPGSEPTPRGGFSNLLGWAFGPRKLMKNCHADFIATHERPRD